MDLTTILILVAILLLVILPLMLYNSLVRRRNQVDNVFASLDALLKKRYDLIPNLIATVQTYMQHEKETLTRITELRNKAISGTISSNESVELNNEISGILKTIQVSVENYPDLKASTNFVQLQGSLNEVEEQISAGRRAYNAAVTDFNTAIQIFPASILAGMMKFTPKTLFFISEAERQNVNVKNLFNN